MELIDKIVLGILFVGIFIEMLYLMYLWSDKFWD